MITINKTYVAEQVINKSSFICTLIPIISNEEAQKELSDIRKKYYDATHNCYAYVFGLNGEYARCSDDGEPAGTAGKPMLEVLLGAEVRNVVAVVTRYFGGTLLGTGGLVRAYTQAVQVGLEQSRIVTMRYGTELEIRTDYHGIGKVQYILGQLGLEILESTYTEAVSLRLLVPYEYKQRLYKELMEATAGRVKITEVTDCYYETEE